MQLFSRNSRSGRHFSCFSRLLAGLLVAGSCSAATLPVYDDFESGLGNWSSGGAWGLTTARYASPGHAVTDSPGSFYVNNTDASLALGVSLDLTGATRPALGFQHQYALETGYDFGFVEVSTNGGSTWLAPALATFTGNLAPMSLEQLDLSPYAGVGNVRLRFRLVTDSSVVMDGWYVDDVRVAEAPLPVTLQVTQTNRNSVALAWNPANGTGFAAYRLYRSLSPGVDWHTARLIAEIGSSFDTNVSDITASPKTRYYYRLAVVNTDGMLTLGNEIAVTTLAGMDYPFVDNGEGGGATWVADAPWALSEEDAASPTHAWSDSPGTNYVNGIASQALTLAAPMYLAGQAVAPVLSFSHKCAFSAGDSGNAEISVNSGADWTTLATYTGTATNAWRREHISLAAYTNYTVLVRFRVTTGVGTRADGWHLDDISVAEAPAMVPAPVLDEVTSHSIRVTWAPNTNTSFMGYVIFRSTTPGVGVNSTLAATITDQGTTGFTDSNLALDTTYYYRVYAMNGYGTFSPDSPLESSARTLNNPPPLADNFEGGLVNWNLTGSWGLSTNSTHGGNWALTDSPQGNYFNSADSVAQTALNLVGTLWPVLRFWDRHQLADSDWGWAEVSPDGATWTRIYGVAGTRGEWVEQSIDLSPWRNQANLRLRFHMTSDGSGTQDGWYVDDLSVADHAPGQVGLPFAESFEGGVSNWLHAGWHYSTNAAYAGVASARSTTGVRMPLETTHWLELDRELRLTNVVNPQMTFWLRGRLENYSSVRPQVSGDGGLTWADLTGVTADYGFNADWTRRQASLQGYVNQAVRLRFQIASFWGSAPYSDVALDKITVAEMPVPVGLLSLTPQLRSVDLTWSESALGGAFRRYEVYRATHAAVTLSDTLVGSFSNAAVTNMTDTGLSIGATYYYVVFTVDANDTYTPSNERTTTTVPVVAPLVDAFGDNSQWVTTGSWGIASTGGRDGGPCLADSPSSDYTNSSDMYALTAVSLSGTAWPVLRFWDRHQLADSDWGWAEVSPDGATWTRIYGVAGTRGEWVEQSIDLSPWRNQANLRLRFHMTSDGSGTQDGWYVDDLSVADHAPGQVGLPFAESFEGGVSNWLHAGWHYSTNAAYAGVASARSTTGVRMPLETTHWLELDRELRLTNVVNPQMTFWLRGRLENYSSVRPQVSGDGGLTWADLTGVTADYGFNADWTRRQASLQGYVNQAVRLRFQIASFWGSAPYSDVALDKITVAEMPVPVGLLSLTPQLRSVDLTWSESALGGAFRRYEVYRATHAAVTLSDTLVGSFSNAAVTNMTDTGLSIGATYYYVVFTVDANDTYTPSNERTTTTVPVVAPLVDAFGDNSQWVTTGSWGIASTGGRDGGPCLADSPSSDYTNSSDMYALTAVSLSGTAWPVLRFWDRHQLADSDWGWAEVSPDGATWTRIYGVAGTRGEWMEQSIDLSPWRNQANLRVRFHMTSDGSGTQDGWYVDDLSVADHAPGQVGLPFAEGFEGGVSNWLHAGWNYSTNAAYAGTASARSTTGVRMPLETTHWLELDRELRLTNVVNPQMTFWLRGRLENYSSVRPQLSGDGGLTWADLTGVTADYGFNADWTRRQASLQGYVNQAVRLRFQIASFWGSAPYSDVALDKITIEELPPSVTLNPIDQITVSTLHLSWTVSPLDNFKEYRVFRAESGTVSDASVLVASFTNKTDTSFTDTGLTARKTYYYRVYVYDTSDTGSGSNLALAMTGGLPGGWAESFETNQPGWTFTGTWARQADAGRNGSYALVDSPTDYANSLVSYAQVGVDLTGTTWPVMKFWDRYALADADWGRVYISANAGASWTIVYGAAGTRTNWTEQAIDLSSWKNQSQVWIRFELATDGGTQNDGWYLDDLSLSENTVSGSYPFFETFENGLTNWLQAGWCPDTNQPYGGATAARSTSGARMTPETASWLGLNQELVLTNAVNPQLAFLVRGRLDNYSSLRTQVSADRGLTWSDLSPINRDYGFNSGWTRLQTSLQSYTNRTIRLRFQINSFWGSAPYTDLSFDNVGVGEPVPGAPTLSAPAQLATVSILRPTLIVNNAVDYQTDPLTYRFEVYADASLSNLVAQVPVVASGTSLTTWQLDTDLPNGAQYWWRCQASDGTNTGPWMAAASFYVNQVNSLPLPVIIAGPPAGTILTNLQDRLFWYPTTDPDLGDAVASYQIQADEDPLFASPEINAGNLAVSAAPVGPDWTIAMALSELAGSSNLVAGNIYHWRIRAADTHNGLSAWSAGDYSFQFGIAPPRPATLSGLRAGANGTMVLEWQGASGALFVEFSLSLSSPNWQTIAGPLRGTSWTFTPVPGAQSGFYRVRSE